MAAHSADEAVRLIPRERPAVLLSDIGLPGEDGYKLISRVRALSPEDGGNLPAAAITAYARSDDARRALAAGYQRHAPKPIQRRLAALVAGLAQLHPTAPTTPPPTTSTKLLETARPSRISDSGSRHRRS